MTNASARKKICFVLPSLTAGGAERVLITLMNRLDPAKYERSFIAVDLQGPYRDLIDPAIPVFDLKRTRVSQALFPLVRTIRTINPDIVLSTMVHMNFIVLAARFFLPRPIRFVVREAITPSFILDDLPFPKKLIPPVLWRFLYPKADLVLSPTRLVFDEFENRLGLKLKNKAVLPNPVEQETLRNKAAETVTVSFTNSKAFKLVCAGRLHHQKGFDRLIDELAKLPADALWELLILGTGPEEKSLMDQIRKYGMETKIKLAGLQQNPWAVMAQADLFLLPSRWEGLPNVALESLAVGTPVLAIAEAGGIAEIAENTSKDALEIVSDIKNFGDRLRAIVLDRNHQPLSRNSLLPALYETNNVRQAFSAILEKI